MKIAATLPTDTRESRSGLVVIVHDDPAPLANAPGMEFPDDATAEWETAETLERIGEAWRALGYQTQALPLDRHFFERWNEVRGRVRLVHSVAEGWGSVAREGWIPSLCELAGIPYVGSGPLAQCLAMRKSLMKSLCQAWGVPTAPAHAVMTLDEFDEIDGAFFARPHFIKPDTEGSGMGIDAAHSVCHDRAAARRTVAELLARYPDGVLVEELLPGEEYTSAFVGEPARLLPIAHIEVETGVYGAANKGKDAMEEKVTFPRLADAAKETIERGTIRIARGLGLLDFARFDWKLDARGRPCFLEVNPLAGLSYYYSVLPKMAEAAGIGYADLLGLLGDAAVRRAADRKYWYGRARL